MGMLDTLVEKVFSGVFVRFALGGMLGFVFNLVITYLLTEIVHLNYLVSYVIAITAVTCFNFVVAIKYTFRVKKSYKKIFIKYVISVVVFYFLNILFVRLFVEYLKIHYLISIAITTGTMFLIKFFIADRYLFKE